METPQLKKALDALNAIIKKSRVHLYKPIQIAEILYHHRVYGGIDLLNLEDYRKPSKEWRDKISLLLVGARSTSTAKFQDDLFNPDAMPPSLLNELGIENLRTKGGIEAYIYNKFFQKHRQLAEALAYCRQATPATFSVNRFINSFWTQPGLRRSLDKIYEIVVHSLFSTLVEALNLKVEVSIAEEALPVLREFEDFSKKVMCLDAGHLTHVQSGKVFRVGVTNAADRGLDMYSNWGPAIQVKHLSLNAELAENIVGSISSDKIVIVCKTADKDIIGSLLVQLGWKSRIQSIVTEEELTRWYEKALRGQFASCMAKELLSTLVDEIEDEFPSVASIPEEIAVRNYDFDSYRR